MPPRDPCLTTFFEPYLELGIDAYLKPASGCLGDSGSPFSRVRTRGNVPVEIGGETCGGMPTEIDLRG
jgi:hypothetical protein